MSESVVLCEGYHDRAFWAGWLLYLGCVDPGKPTPGHVRRGTIRDPWNDPVAGGHFAFHSLSGKFVRIQRCQGRTNIRPAAERRLAQRASRAITRLVLNIDADTQADGTATSTGLRQQDMLQFITSTIDPAALLNADGEIEIDRGATMIALVRWETTDTHGPSPPPQQTLERLVTAALIAAYPTRAKAVQDWLASRPSPPSANPKEHAWSHMAGWYAEHGCDAFYSNLWNDPAVVHQLESRLKAAGAWQIASALTG
jgi:hypothetical protein